MDKIHLFEQAGLGKAPFRFVGLETAADRAAIQTERASAGQTFTTNYATSCDYCGQGIQNAYRVESADGKTFKVGCDCIRKTGDVGLRRVISEEESRKRRAKKNERRAREWAEQQALKTRFTAGEFDEVLSAIPHPKRGGETLHDYVAFCFSCGAREAAVRTIKKHCQEVPA